MESILQMPCRLPSRRARQYIEKRYMKSRLAAARRIFRYHRPHRRVYYRFRARMGNTQYAMQLSSISFHANAFQNTAHAFLDYQRSKHILMARAMPMIVSLTFSPYHFTRADGCMAADILEHNLSLRVLLMMKMMHRSRMVIGPILILLMMPMTYARAIPHLHGF